MFDFVHVVCVAVFLFCFCIIFNLILALVVHNFVLFVFLKKEKNYKNIICTSGNYTLVL